MELEEELEKRPAHHKQDKVAYNRPDYREGKRERSVKVYTVNRESKYIVVQNVHALGVTQELLQLFSLCGKIEEYRLLYDYPSEPYTDVYWIKYVDIDSARVARKRHNHKSFFGKQIHVCYASEYETVQETREKLQQRRKVIAKKTRETFESAQKAKVKEEETRTEQSLSASPPTSASHTHTSVSESHNVLVIPGLPPLPQLPSPPTHSTPTHYPSSLGGSGGGLYSTSCEQEPGKSSSLSQPCEKSFGSQRRAKPSLSVVTTHSEPKMDAVLFNPAGLSKSERMSEYLATADTKTASLIEGSAGTHGLVGGRAAHLRVTPHSQVTGPTPRTTGPISTVASTLPRQTGSTSRQTGPAVDSSLHRVTSNSNGAAEMAKTLHCSSTPLIAVTGNHSLDKSIQSVRDQMTKVWETAPITLTKPKPKKRKRI